MQFPMIRNHIQTKVWIFTLYSRYHLNGPSALLQDGKFQFKETVSQDRIETCIELMDRTEQAHVSRRFLDF